MTDQLLSVNGTRKGQTLLKGHTLMHEGHGFTHPGDAIPNRRGKCSCGVLSDQLDSTRARKRWHVEHKAEIRRTAELASQAN